jgi:hypothetical protein
VTARKKASDRRSLGTVERHKVERWITRRLRDAIWSARSAAEGGQRDRRLEVAHELVDMLRAFQDRAE